MTPRSPSAFLLSASLHALLVAVALLFAYVINDRVKDQPKVFELVAGDGDNYAATDAPALGVTGGIKLSVPQPPAPAPTPPAAVETPPPVEATPEPAPVISKAPVAKPVKTPVKPAPTAIPNFTRQLDRKLIRKESQVRQQIKKARAAEQKRLSKEEFDRENRAKIAAATGNPRAPHVDADGIAAGVTGGSSANKSGGAGGKALHREEGELMDAYFSLVKRKLKDALDKPPGLSDSITAVAEFRLGSDGSISGARISTSSGSADFDRAVLEAIGRYRTIGPRPDKKGETVELTFRMKEDDDE